MSAILKTVKLGDIRPNPWRDGTGKATWESVATTYGYSELKLAELDASVRKNNVWEGIIGRERGGGVEIAFGHHRVEAARRAGIPAAPIIIRELTDEQMLSFMANENSTEFGASFPLGVMNPVEALLNAYAAGVEGIDLTPPDIDKPGFNKSVLRYAAIRSDQEATKPFTLLTVAAKFGWVQNVGKTNYGALPKVGIAVDLLEYERMGLVTRARLLTLATIADAARLRDLTAAAIAKAEQDAKKAVALPDKPAKKAKPKGEDEQPAEETSPKPKATTTPLAKVEPALRSVQHIINDVLDKVDSGSSLSDAMKEEGLKLQKKQKAQQRKKAEPFRFDSAQKAKLADRLNGLLKENVKWDKCLEGASDTRADRALVDALTNLSKRAVARSREYIKAGGM